MDTLRLRDFDLEIGPGDGASYPVAVLNSPSGQARATMAFPFAGPDALDAELAAIEAAVLGTGGKAATEQVQNFGARLFHALFTDEIRTVYDRSQQATAAAGEGLRIRLRINAPDLATVPWEFLFDPRPAEFVALSRHTPIVRYLELPLAEPDLTVSPPLRILGMVANPVGVPELNIEGEKRRIEKALEPLGDKVELVWLPGQTVQHLQTALQSGPWHVFHFIGHAAVDSSEGVLLLADEKANPDPLTATQLGRLLSDHRTLRLAVLNACQGAKGNEQSLFSSLAASLVRRGLPAVLAMQYDISDGAAVEFTGSFYGALAANLPIDAASSEGRKAIASLDTAEWGTPLLIMRAPDGVIWDVREPPSCRWLPSARQLWPRW
ncbi:MAG: CHAT domain-containing protein [Caldilineales bacterium]